MWRGEDHWCSLGVLKLNEIGISRDTPMKAFEMGRGEDHWCSLCVLWLNAIGVSTGNTNDCVFFGSDG